MATRAEEYDPTTPPCDEPVNWHRPLLYGFLWALGAHRTRISDDRLHKPSSVNSFEEETSIVGKKPTPPTPPQPHEPPKPFWSDDVLFSNGEPAREEDVAQPNSHLMPKVLRSSSGAEPHRQSFEGSGGRLSGDAASASNGGRGSDGGYPQSGSASPSWGWYSTGSGGSTPSSAQGLQYPASTVVKGC